MKRFFGIISLIAVIAMTVACSDSKRDSYVGKFTDEFGNKFELRKDYTAGIELVGTQRVNEQKWSDGDNHELPYAMISFNGNPAYWYLRDGMLYTSMEHMAQGHPAIKITWVEE